MHEISGSTSTTSSAPNDERPRRDCELRFASVEQTLDRMGVSFTDMSRRVEDAGIEAVRQQESVRGLWKELRDDVMPVLRELPRSLEERVDRQLAAADARTKETLQGMAGRLEKHEAGCPARRRAMRRAESDSADGIPVQALRDDPTGMVATPTPGALSAVQAPQAARYEIPRPLLWVGGIIGAAVAASGYVLHLLWSQ